MRLIILSPPSTFLLFLHRMASVRVPWLDGLIRYSDQHIRARVTWWTNDTQCFALRDPRPDPC
jgi:hypothetical protein